MQYSLLSEIITTTRGFRHAQAVISVSKMLYICYIYIYILKLIKLLHAHGCQGDLQPGENCRPSLFLLKQHREDGWVLEEAHEREQRRNDERGSDRKREERKERQRESPFSLMDQASAMPFPRLH